MRRTSAAEPGYVRRLITTDGVVLTFRPTANHFYGAFDLTTLVSSWLLTVGLPSEQSGDRSDQSIDQIRSSMS